MSSPITKMFNPGFGLVFDDGFFDRFAKMLYPCTASDKKTNEPGQPNYYTNDDGSELYVELPGCKKENISVEADPDTGIVVRATREVAGKKGSYRISFKPDRGGFDVERMKPSFVDGLLTIPIKEKKQEARKLTIE